MKKYEDKDRNRILSFKCTCCEYNFTELNGFFENVPEKCPECKDGKIEEYFPGCTYGYDRTRQRNWKKGLTQHQIANCLASEKNNPY